jgi:hypothetical protein
MSNVPESYLDCKRPPLLEAIELEGGTPNEACASLEWKGYFTPPPRPWSLGFKDRGMGRGDYAVLDRFGYVVVEAPNQVTAELIINAVNNHKEA